MAIKKLPSTGDMPRSTGVPASLVPGGAADSAGFPWAGRTFDHHETAFAGDDGSAPEALRAAVGALREAASGGASPVDYGALADAHGAALAALSASRVLIPLLTGAGDLGLTPEGKTVEKTQELSIVTVAGPDGRRVMPVFSSVDAMRAWNPEQTDLIIVDPGTPEWELGVRRTQLQGVALAQPVTPAWADAAVAEAFRAALRDDARVLDVRLEPGDPEARLLAPETDVVLVLAPGLDQAALGELLGAAQQRWAASELIAERVDSLRVRLAAA